MADAAFNRGKRPEELWKFQASLNRATKWDSASYLFIVYLGNKSYIIRNI